MSTSGLKTESRNEKAPKVTGRDGQPHRDSHVVNRVAVVLEEGGRLAWKAGVSRNFTSV